jgi:hypothetical protein
MTVSQMRLIDAAAMQMFKVSMNATKSSSNLRRARGEIKNFEAMAKVIHQDNVKHMYSKRVHRNAGEFLVEGASIISRQTETVITGDVTIAPTVKRRQVA